MTSRIWTGGHDGNDAGSAANWSPNGSPQPGDDLNVVTGTLEINGPNSLAGNTLHLNDPAVGVGPVVLDMNGWGARAAIDGSLQAGDQLIINAIGQDYLDATGGVEHGASSGGSINLADHAHLYVTGTMHFGYGGALTGGIGSLLTNYGRINLGSSNIPADFPGLVSPVSGTVSVLVNGDGTLVFRGYHNAYGYASISAPITAAQTVECNPGYDGMLLTLSDPGDFHAC